jgi:multidrug efflux system outer membrane protein
MKMKSATLLIPGACCVAALVLAGCTMAPDYACPASPVAGAYPAAPTNTSPTASDVPWEEFFVDGQLKSLIRTALENNRDLRVAVLNVEQSQAQYRVTRSALVPGASAAGSYTRSHGGGVTSSQWSASLGSTAYEIDFFGRVRSLNKQALEKYFSTDEARRSSRISVIAEVATDYFTYRQAEEQLALARKTLGTVKDSFELNQATFDAGGTSELDLRTAEGQVLNSRINIITYERELAQARNALELVVGRPLTGTDLAPSTNNTLVNGLAVIPPGVPSDLITRRPDILEAEYTLKAANANIGAARAAFFPSIKLTGSIGTTSDQFSKLFGSGTGLWSFSPQVTVPIFTGGENRANLDAAKVAKQITIAQYEKAIQTAFREVADALAGVDSYGRQIVEQEALIRTQQTRFDLANERYRGDIDTYLNVLSAQQDLYSAQQGLLSARYGRVSSQITLYKALGGGLK